MKNFLHHFEYENSGLGVEDIEKLVKERKPLYDYSVDQRKKKWATSSELVKINLDLLPNYILENKEKYKEWLI